MVYLIGCPCSLVALKSLKPFTGLPPFLIVFSVGSMFFKVKTFLSQLYRVKSVPLSPTVSAIIVTGSHLRHLRHETPFSKFFFIFFNPKKSLSDCILLVIGANLIDKDCISSERQTVTFHSAWGRVATSFYPFPPCRFRDGNDWGYWRFSFIIANNLLQAQK